MSLLASELFARLRHHSPVKNPHKIRNIKYGFLILLVCYLSNSGCRRHAAVLVGLVGEDNQNALDISVILTERTHHISHGGDVSFPGGVMDAIDDHNVLHTAYREAEEEIGLERHLVKPLGELEQIPSKDYRLVHPIIARVDRSFVPKLNTNEVANLFMVPLRQFTINDGHTHKDIVYRDVFPHRLHYFDLGGATVWGLTATLILRMLEIGGIPTEFEVYNRESTEGQPPWMKHGLSWNERMKWGGNKDKNVP